MIALEPNGTRYPTQAQEDQFYQNQIVAQLEIVGIGVLIIAIMVGVMIGIRSHKEETEVASLTNEESQPGKT